MLKEVPPLNPEREVVAELAQQFRALARELDVEVLSLVFQAPAPRSCHDFIVVLRVGEKTRRVVVEAKAPAFPHRVRDAIMQLKAACGSGCDYPVVGAPYLSEQSRVLCREAGVGYMDLCGNAFIKMPGLLVDRRSGEPPATQFRPLKSVLGKKGSRVVRVLLQDCGRAWTLTELARAAQVSMGMAHNVCRQLLESGLVVRQADKNLSLASFRGLLELWRESYRLSEASRLHRYYAWADSPQALMELLATKARTGGYALTLFAGASLVAPVTIFSTVAAYARGATAAELAAALEARPVSQGENLQLIEPHDDGVFYGLRAIGRLAVVGDVQLYLDLYNHPNRGREQADALAEALWRERT
jgi:hypothetical protein